MQLKRLGPLVLFLAGLGPALAQAEGKSIRVWLDSQEDAEIFGLYAQSPQAQGSGLGLSVELIPADCYRSRLEKAIGDSTGPDVYAIDLEFLREYVESGRCADLSPLKRAYANNFGFGLDMAKDASGRLMALSWELSPSVFLYRRDLAQAYLGSADGEAVGQLLSSPAGFLAAARAVKQRSGGRDFLLPTARQLLPLYLCSRSQAWVSPVGGPGKQGAFTVDPLAFEGLQAIDLYRAEGLEASLAPDTAAWEAGLTGELSDESGRPRAILGYFLSARELRRLPEGLLRGRGLAAGPGVGVWDGTWWAISPRSARKQEAMDLLRFLCSDENFLEGLARQRLMAVANAKVMARLRSGPIPGDIEGQNRFAIFYSQLRGLSAASFCAQDGALSSAWADAVRLVAGGQSSPRKAIDSFVRIGAGLFP